MRVHKIDSAAVCGLIALLPVALVTARASAVPSSGAGSNVLATHQQLVNGQELVTGPNYYGTQYSLRVGGAYPLEIVERIATPIFYLQVVNWAPVTWPADYPRGSSVTLRVQDDGDVVLYGAGTNVLWHANTDTPGPHADRLYITAHGAIELMNRDAYVRWTNGTTSRFLRAGQALHAGGQLQVFGPAAPRAATLSMQHDGNVVVRLGTVVRWASGTHVAGSRLVNADGSLFLLSPSNAILWASPSAGTDGLAEVGSDGSLIGITQRGHVIWRRPA